MTFDKILGGWADAYRVTKCYLHAGRSSLVNTHGETLDLWGGLGSWWVEEHILQVERDIAKSLEDAFGSSEPPAHADSDSISFTSGGISRLSISANGSFGLGTTAPSTQLTLTNSNLSYPVVSSSEHNLMVTSNKPSGKWVWERVAIESDSSPNPIRRTLISLLTGAKWTPYSSKHETKYYGYLRLMPNPAHLTQKTPSIS